MNQESIIILKFGGSVLQDDRDVERVAHHIYKFVREGTQLVVVVSALEGRTNELFAGVLRNGECDSSSRIAAALACGEHESVARLTLALDRIGIDAVGMDARELGIRVRGDHLDGTPSGVDVQPLRRRLATSPVVVVPGFLGVHEEDGSVATFGRGGSDLTAVLLTHALDARRCILLKDVDGLYEADPRGAHGSRPGRFVSVSWEDATRLSGEILQSKAALYAFRHRLRFEVGGLGDRAPTQVGPGPTRLDLKSSDSPLNRPIRVALLGCGVVGRGVYELLNSAPDRYEVVGIAIREPTRHVASAIPERLLTTDAEALIRRGLDLVVEAIGGLSPATELVGGALSHGIGVVTANKAVVAKFGSVLSTVARRRSAPFAYSAAVGGATPVLETVRRLVTRTRLQRIDAAVNGATSFIFDRIGSGCSVEDATEIARERGFTEFDPTDDLSGLDLAYKAAILAEASFGVWVDPDRIVRSGLESIDIAEVRRAYQRDERVRLVATIVEESDEPSIHVSPRAIARTNPLARLGGEWTTAVLRTAGDEVFSVTGRGAGRRPTSAAVFADIEDVRRQLQSGIGDGWSRHESTLSDLRSLLTQEGEVAACVR
ncbi:MAG: homoserine dehydrogenase [Phycisphaerales bacterium]